MENIQIKLKLGKKGDSKLQNLNMKAFLQKVPHF